jgi:general secretion pathway protein N
MRALMIVTVLATIVGTVIACAPASWLGDMVEARSPVRLVYAAGTVWNGSALLAVSDGQQARLVPGRVAWRIRWSEALTGRIVMDVRHAAAPSPVSIGFDGRALHIAAGEARLPAALLSALGAPFNTVRPGGTLYARWDALEIRRDGFDGSLAVDWEEAQSALSPVAPLGNFRITARGHGARSEAKLVTLKGPLLIDGAGSLENGTMRFSATAGAEPAMRSSLNGLIAVLGRRSGDQAVLNWELRK